MKFFLFGDSKAPIPANVRIFNKVGLAYGYMVDNAYVADLEENVEFLLTAVLLVNDNGILQRRGVRVRRGGVPLPGRAGKGDLRLRVAARAGEPARPAPVEAGLRCSLGRPPRRRSPPRTPPGHGWRRSPPASRAGQLASHASLFRPIGCEYRPRRLRLDTPGDEAPETFRSAGLLPRRAEPLHALGRRAASPSSTCPCGKERRRQTEVGLAVGRVPVQRLAEGLSRLFASSAVQQIPAHPGCRRAAHLAVLPVQNFAVDLEDRPRLHLPSRSRPSRPGGRGRSLPPSCLGPTGRRTP